MTGTPGAVLSPGLSLLLLQAPFDAPREWATGPRWHNCLGAHLFACEKPPAGPGYTTSCPSSAPAATPRWATARRRYVSTFPTIAITLGDPAGIGPEVVAKALTMPEVQALGTFIVIGNVPVMQRALDAIGSPLRATPVHGPSDDPGGTIVRVLDDEDGSLIDLSLGAVSADAGRASVKCQAAKPRWRWCGCGRGWVPSRGRAARCNAPTVRGGARVAGRRERKAPWKRRRLPSALRPPVALRTVVWARGHW